MTEQRVATNKLKLAFLLWSAALMFMVSLWLHAQDGSAAKGQVSPASPAGLAFDVASIKPANDEPGGDRHFSLDISPDGEVRVTNWTLKDLICAAYNLSSWQIQGGPAWIEKDLFDITAKPSDPTTGAPAYNIHHDNGTLDDPKLRTMLQALLEDRFALKTHVATKEGPVYILERGDGELALIPSKHPSRDGGLGGIGLGTNNGRVLLNTSMASLAGELSGYVFHQPVIDKTGLTGTYDFVTKNIPGNEEAFPPGGTPDMTLLIRYVKEMGLKLTKSTGPVPTLVIDQASQPSPN
ncbi:MAG TPA: TIGR03435 family protein [Acidobacteriaceae bacterium]|nr:TIGR03435 family protein [Acidobacteriaceae bacterium]